VNTFKPRNYFSHFADIALSRIVITRHGTFFALIAAVLLMIPGAGLNRLRLWDLF
jgi:hypothetical protein